MIGVGMLIGMIAILIPFWLHVRWNKRWGRYLDASQEATICMRIQSMVYPYGIISDMESLLNHIEDRRKKAHKRVMKALDDL